MSLLFSVAPIQRMQIELLKMTQQLGRAGHEVLELRMDAGKAVITVAGVGLEAQYHENGFGVIQDGAIRIVWRESEAGAQGD